MPAPLVARPWSMAHCLAGFVPRAAALPFCSCAAQLSQNCPRKIVTYPFNGTITSPDFAANSGSFVWELNGEVSTTSLPTFGATA